MLALWFNKSLMKSQQVVRNRTVQYGFITLDHVALDKHLPIVQFVRWLAGATNFNAT